MTDKYKFKGINLTELFKNNSNSNANSTGMVFASENSSEDYKVAGNAYNNMYMVAGSSLFTRSLLYEKVHNSNGSNSGYKIISSDETERHIGGVSSNPKWTHL